MAEQATQGSSFGSPDEPGSLTRAEIYQQPELWQTTVRQLATADLFPVHAGIPVAITGAGTSAYAAAAVANAVFKGRAIPSTDLLVDPTLLADAGLLISLARSGDSPESLAVVHQTQRLTPTVRHLAITCNKDGRLANTVGVQSVVLDPRTNDRSLVMTSSFTNLVLAGLCLHHGERLRHEINGLKQRAESHLAHWNEVASELAEKPPARVVCLASAPLYPLAREAALKILEMTAGAVIPMAETFLGLRHGPMSFLQKDSLVISFLSSDPTRRSYERDLIRELHRKHLGRIVAVDGSLSSEADSVPSGAPDLPDFLRVPFEAPFAQLLAYRFSLRCGLNPDKPSPDNVISRVVSDFHIHGTEFSA